MNHGGFGHGERRLGRRWMMVVGEVAARGIVGELSTGGR